MPQLRQDLITGRWVAVATERARRPDSFTQAARESVAAKDVCPFCPGHESMTPPEVLAYRAPGLPVNSEGWSIRVVPNLYAAFRPEPDGQLCFAKQVDHGLADPRLVDHQRSTGSHATLSSIRQLGCTKPPKRDLKNPA